MTRLIRIAVFGLPLITVVMAQGGGYALDFDGLMIMLKFLMLQQSILQATQYQPGQK